MLNHARRELELANIETLSMRELAKKVGVSHAAAYRHFAHKKALLDAIAVGGFEDLAERCSSAMRTAVGDRAARLMACGLAYVRFGLENPRLLGHMFISVMTDDASPNAILAGAAVFDILLTAVTDGQKEHIFRPGNTREFAHACWATVHGTTVILGITASPLSETNIAEKLATAERTIETLLNGLLMKV